MAWKDPYAILGVGRGAPPSQIKRAYRKLAFSLHPDVGDNPDETRFREAREAYQALIQMEQRHPIEVVRAPDRSGHAGTMHVESRGRLEPIRRRPPVNLIDDFATVRPSVGENRCLWFANPLPSSIESLSLAIRHANHRNARLPQLQICGNREVHFPFDHGQFAAEISVGKLGATVGIETTDEDVRL
jgi:hypothetical protein